jgi:gamma-glutamyltranspeptidase/glutathione hydrolase
LLNEETMRRRSYRRARAEGVGAVNRIATQKLAFWFLLAVVVLTSAPPAPADGREPVHARHGMVASVHPLATEVGVDVLRRGGNAVDAAVAVALALAVVYPDAGNLGGGGFMLVRMADGRAVAIDYRETAPAAATREMYLDASGRMIPEASTIGHKAVGVPGTPAGLALALEQFGTLKWADLIEPARRLAAGGYRLSWLDERTVAAEVEHFQKSPEAARIFLKDGKARPEGELFTQQDLARTMERLQKYGPREFYEGETARMIVDDMRAHNGLITAEDLRDYRPRLREPLRGSYRGYEVITMPPPSSGGIALLQMLQMLERFDLRASGFGSSQTIHLMVEAMRRAYADRAEYLGDPDFASVPVRGLTSKIYATERGATIDPRRASTSAEVGGGQPARFEPTETTHFTIIDVHGNVVSNTFTLNGSYGACVVARGTGVLLNNEMDDFTARPGTPNMYGLIQKEANAIQPGKRPLSSMTPTIVLRDGRVWFAVGTPGGSTIINTVLQVIVNIVDHGMNIREAIDAPRVHHQWLPDVILYEPGTMVADVRQALEQRGHKLTDRLELFGHSAWLRSFGNAQGVLVDSGTGRLHGWSDGRYGGAAAGY